MGTVIDNLRLVLGEPNIVVDGVVNFNALAEYLFAGIILCIVVNSIFKFICKAVDR